MELIVERFWISGQYDLVDKLWQVVAWEKVRGGIKQLIHLYSAYDEDCIKEDVGNHGNFSPRPFLVGSGCDGTTDECCHALYWDFCQKSGLDAGGLHRQAYQSRRGDTYQEPDYCRIKQIAEWQGVEYPCSWRQRELPARHRSLHAINNRSLVAVLAQHPVGLALGSNRFLA